MKKALRCLAVLAVLALTAWASVPGTAHAIPSCASYHGDPCSEPLASFSCMRSNGSMGLCTCTGTHWYCSQ